MQKALQRLARDEGVSQRFLKTGIQTGRIVFVKNRKHRIKPLVIGEGTHVKINANIGTSPDVASLKHELKKLAVSIEAGADTEIGFDDAAVYVHRGTPCSGANIFDVIHIVVDDIVVGHDICAQFFRQLRPVQWWMQAEGNHDGDVLARNHTFQFGE